MVEGRGEQSRDRIGLKSPILVLAVALMMCGCAGLSDLQSPSLFSAKSDSDAKSDIPLGPQSELQKATQYWGEEYSKKPQDLDTALSYAKNLKALGQKQQALSVLQQASLFHSNDKKLNSEYGRLALDLDQVSAAQQLLAAADDPAKPDWRVVSARGTVLAKQGNYSEAIPFYERALQLSADQPSVMNNLALAYAMNGEAARAEEVLRRASATGAVSPKVRQNLALVLGLQGKYDEATKIGSEAGSTDTAASNTDIIKQIVRLDAKPYAAPVQGTWEPAVAIAAPLTLPSQPAAEQGWKTKVAMAPARAPVQAQPPAPNAAGPAPAPSPAAVGEPGPTALRTSAN